MIKKRFLYGSGCALLLWLAALHPSAQAQTIPNAPINLTASVVSAFQISLSWADASTNEDGFKVERSLDGTNFSQIAQVSSNVTNYRNAGLFPSTTYSYRVRAYNAGGASAFSAVASAGTPAPACPLSVVGWGYNVDGEVSPPTTLTNVVAIAAGQYHSLAINRNGTVIGWGYDVFGETTIPGGYSNVVAVSAGAYHSLALTSDRTVIAWGYNGDGEITIPAGLSNVVAIAAGYYHSLALKSDGTVVAWGYNGFGQTNVPAGLAGVVAISAGYYHSLALKSDGTVVAWGYNCCGQTMPPAGLSNVVAIAAGGYHGLALKSDGTVVGWGYNGYGQTTTPSGLSGVLAIAGGIFHSMTLRSDGSTVAWGYNLYGQTATPPGLTGVAAIAGGTYFSLALAPGPGSPSALTATQVGGNEIDLSWAENSSSVQGFRIDRAPDAGGNPGTWAQIATPGAGATTYSDTAVVTSATYWYRIRANNTCGASPYSALKVPTTLVLDDTWSTGVRTNQNLPTSSAWWTSTAGALDAAASNMTLTVGGSSSQIITYFTPDSNSPPIQLNIGDTLTATFKFTFNGVPPNGSSSQGFRFGLFDFADGNNSPKRVSSDGLSVGSQGSSVAGYALFGKVYGKLSDATPIDIRKRINLSSSSLLGTSGDFTSLAKDSLDTNSFGGFANLTPYTLQFVLQRTGLNSMVVTITWLNTVTGATLSDSVTDNSASNFSFDGVGYRPSNNTTAPATNDFQEVTITVSSAPTAPAVTTEPQGQSVFEGQNATFAVVPNGTLPLSYQWYYNTNTPIANATNSTLALTNVHLADAGGYSVLLSNPYGAVTSAAGQLTVGLAAPAISTQPQNLTVIPGQFATFSVTASGSQPLIYQWYYNTNTLLAGATGASVILTNVQSTNAGSYSVVVSNTAGAVTSSNAVLTVNTNPAAPVFITQPASVHVYAGDTASFTATTVGTQPIVYHWNKNTVPIPSANASVLTLTNVQPSDAGSYTVVASNSVGSTTSTGAVLTVTLKSPPLLPNIPTNQFNVINFGAVGDGVTNNATAIQSTINAAAAAGGGTVEIPSAGSLSTYLSGPIVLSNNVNLKIDGGAMLQMLPRSNWPGTATFISGTTLHDVEISGLGSIDGQGTNWWFPLAGSRPNFISFSGCTNVLVQDVTLQNPPTFHLMLKGNNAGITIQGIIINTPGDSPNTDGMDLASTNVLIRNCFISDGDDNIEIGGSGGPAADITVSNCTFGTGHGVSIGSITSGGVHDIIVSNCTFNGTVNGIRMKSDNDRGGLIQNLQYLDITMTNVAYPITIYSYYNTIGTPNNISPSIASVQPVAPVTSLTPIWQNILISNLTVVATTGLNIDGIIWGRTEMLVSNVTFYDVNITAPTNTFVVYNAQGIQFIDSHLTTPTSTNTFTLYNAQITVSNSAPNATLVTLGGLAIPPTNNTMAFFNAQAAITDTNMLGTNPNLTLGGTTLTVSNSLSLGGATTLNFALGANTAEIVVPGALVLGGTLNVADGGGFGATTYTLFSYSGALTYNGLAIGATPSTNFTYAISTNTPGQVNLVVTAVAPTDPFTAWQNQYFGSSTNAQAQPGADPFGKGMSNTNQFLAGLNPTNPASLFKIISTTRNTTDVVIVWRTAGGHTNIVQATGSAGYTANFNDISAPIIIPGNGDATTNYTDSGGATNTPSRYYRVRLVP
ncbi:MAG TPA: glycosyl hydrolase family 28 protein [Verrucomicrobiae bacterium]|nr:glycosyl hydrolase family 28 protein [Verrucomicrobiae bacterium]